MKIVRLKFGNAVMIDGAEETSTRPNIHTIKFDEQHQCYLLSGPKKPELITRVYISNIQYAVVEASEENVVKAAGNSSRSRA